MTGVTRRLMLSFKLIGLVTPVTPPWDCISLAILTSRVPGEALPQ